MEVQLVCCGHPFPKTILSNHHFNSSQAASARCPTWNKIYGRYIRCEVQGVRFGNALKSYVGSNRKIKCFHSPNSGIGEIASASSYDRDANLKSSGRRNSSRASAGRFDRREPFGGKSGSVSFYGLTYHVIEEGKLVSSPFKDGTGSFVWVLAPVALIASLVLPQFFLSNYIDSVLKDDILAEIVTSFSSETMFYIGLAAFLQIADHVQRPYLQFSAKRWGLITGLKGYLISAFLTMGFKVIAPLFVVFATWSVLGLPALVAVAPFLLGCAAQFVFETRLDKRGSSCWPLVPIIFEVYRLYQLSKAAHFIERLMFSMKETNVTPELLERSGALVAMLVSFQVLGVVCLWSLMAFLLRLFPSRPVAENY